jgi:hypothetical protein
MNTTTVFKTVVGIPSWDITLSKGIMFICLVFLSPVIYAQKSNVVRHTVKALGKTPVVKELTELHKHKVDRKLKQMTKLLGDNAGVIIAAGVIAKLAIDGRAKYKAKISKDTDYDIGVDLSGEISSGISSKIEGLKDSSYDFTVYSKRDAQGVRAGLKFSFD